GDAANNLLISLLDDRDPIVQRRALESILRAQVHVPLAKLKPLLASDDRFVRYSARLVLERGDVSEWRTAILGDPNPRVAVAGLIALNKTGAVAVDPKIADAAFGLELDLLR